MSRGALGKSGHRGDTSKLDDEPRTRRGAGSYSSGDNLVYVKGAPVHQGAKDRKGAVNPNGHLGKGALWIANGRACEMAARFAVRTWDVGGFFSPYSIT